MRLPTRNKTIFQMSVSKWKTYCWKTSFWKKTSSSPQRVHTSEQQLPGLKTIEIRKMQDLKQFKVD